MDDAIQPDAPDDSPEPPDKRRADPTRNRRKAKWRNANRAKATAAMARWRARHAHHWRDYMRRYMAARRAAAKQSVDSGEPLAY